MKRMQDCLRVQRNTSITIDGKKVQAVVYDKLSKYCPGCVEFESCTGGVTYRATVYTAKALAKIWKT